MYDDFSDGNSGEVNPDEDSVVTIDKVKSAYQSTTEEMLRLNRVENLDEVADIIYN